MPTNLTPVKLVKKGGGSVSYIDPYDGFTPSYMYVAPLIHIIEQLSILELTVTARSRYIEYYQQLGI